MAISSLIDLYKRLQPNVKHVYVVPLIRYDLPNTNYLYLLYKPILDHNNEVTIHSTSAIGHFKFVLAQLLGKRPILHYHWLEFQDLKSLLGMPYKLFCIWLYCLFGGRLVWTVHNLMPHDQKFLNLHKGLHKWMAKKANTVLVHSSAAQKLASEYLGISEKKISIHPHPDFPANILQKEEALEILQEKILTKKFHFEKPVFLMFGGISEYKGILEIVQLLERFDGTVNLIVAGFVKRGQFKLDEELRAKSESIPWLHYAPGFIPDQLISPLLSSSDVCVFNYRDILTSGGIEMAICYQRTIFAPKFSSLSDYDNKERIHFFASDDDFIVLCENFLKKDSHD